MTSKDFSGQNVIFYVGQGYHMSMYAKNCIPECFFQFDLFLTSSDLIIILGSLSANGWGCVPVLLVVWHGVSSTVACWSLGGAGS